MERNGRKEDRVIFIFSCLYKKENGEKINSSFFNTHYAMT